LRIIREHGSNTDQNGIMPSAQRVGLQAGSWAGDPLAFARPSGDPAIKRCGQFQRDQGPSVHHAHPKPGDDVVRLIAQHAGCDSHPSRLQPRKPGAIDAWVWVTRGDHNARNACCNEGVATRRGAAMVATGFECDIRCGTVRRIARHRQRLRFCVRAPARRRCAAADNPTVFDNDTSNRRIRPGAPNMAPR